MRVAYLGNLAGVLTFLEEHRGVELAAWVVEQGDLDGTSSAETVKTLPFKVFPVLTKGCIRRALKEAGPLDLGIIANFGIILPPDVLTIPARGFVNAHMGLLPENRGKNPIETSIRRGDLVTGVTLHRVTEIVDAGPVLSTRTISMGAAPEPCAIFDRLSSLVPDMLSEHLSSESSSKR